MNKIEKWVIDNPKKVFFLIIIFCLFADNL